MITNGHEKTTKHKQYVCTHCNFVSRKKTDYSIHLTTAKHLKLANSVEKIINDVDEIVISGEKSTKNNKTYTCACGNIYKHNSGYCRHKKLCTFTPPAQSSTQPPSQPPTDNSKLHAIIQLLIKEKQEIRNLFLVQNNNLAEQTNSIVEQNKALTEQNKALTEVIKNQQPMTNSHNNNSHNQNYNINMFLSDKCKDAQNLSEFIEVLKTKVDMMKIGQAGYVNGISKLFIDELNAMEVTERPLHCTDERRNTFYVHNDDAWKKDENLKDTKTAISHVSRVNLQQCFDWSKHTPEDEDDRNDHVTRSIHLYQEAVKSSHDKHVDKIIKNISKEIPLNKQVSGDVVL